MQINEVYISFVNMVNSNATNNNLSIDKFRFVTLFNSTAIRYVQWMLEKRNDDSIRNISNLLILDKQLQPDVLTDTISTFVLPKDYFEFANLSLVASKGNCSGKKISTFEAKSEDVEELLADESNKPSFEWRETFYLLSENKVAAYKTDFSIDKAFLSYYKYPKKVDIAGYINLNNQPSSNIDPDFDDKVVNKILQAMAKEFSANKGDTASYQLNSDRLFSNI